MGRIVEIANLDAPELDAYARALKYKGSPELERRLDECGLRAPVGAVGGVELRTSSIEPDAMDLYRAFCAQVGLA